MCPTSIAAFPIEIPMPNDSELPPTPSGALSSGGSFLLVYRREKAESSSFKKIVLESFSLFSFVLA